MDTKHIHLDPSPWGLMMRYTSMLPHHCWPFKLARLASGWNCRWTTPSNDNTPPPVTDEPWTWCQMIQHTPTPYLLQAAKETMCWGPWGTTSPLQLELLDKEGWCEEITMTWQDGAMTAMEGATINCSQCSKEDSEGHSLFACGGAVAWPFTTLLSSFDSFLVYILYTFWILGSFTVGIFHPFFIPFFSHSHDSHYFSLLFSFILTFSLPLLMRMKEKSKEK